MRQLSVLMPRGAGRQSLQIAEKHKCESIVFIEAQGLDGSKDMVFIQVNNESLDDLVKDLQTIEGMNLSLIPQGILALRPPKDSEPEKSLDITHKSALEVYLGSLQSLGSWKGFLSYAAAAGVVAWIGLFTNTIYLLTASMLIAPFAAPAMNLSIGTARGDISIVKKSLTRYFAGLCLTIFISWLLSKLMGQTIATQQMVETSLISSISFLLPLAAGAAGALNLCQSERSSLVGGAATGMLVAASLAPPAGLIGMAMAFGEWPMVESGLYLLMTQLIGINLTASITFRLFGLMPSGVRFDRGRAWIRNLALAVTVVLAALSMVWQFSDAPNLQRSSKSKRVAALVKETIDADTRVELVESNVRFTRADTPGKDALLIEVFIKTKTDLAGSKNETQSDLVQTLKQNVIREGYSVRPMVAFSWVQ